ncbi:hypothetical protein SAMN05216266_1043 [Amycolatopsis marina]|uniref:Esterase n=1 Tax=Amycolatopsis marina TaxID=490629 RepID=A0A1I0XW11_9PSEU|nr:hypothetical protein SAMN05216266_1043 [Amycolatopsis marina]
MTTAQRHPGPPPAHPPGAASIAGSTVHHMFSSGLREDYRVTVVPPRQWRPATPVLYVLDAHAFLETAVGAARLLGSFGTLPDCPQVCVVGVGPATDDFGAAMRIRGRDLTPTVWRQPNPRRQGSTESGGAARFLDFLTGDVIPWVEAEYPVDPMRRTLFGASLGGLFGLYTLFHRPRAFAGYVLSSPATWWDDGLVLRYERAWAERHDDLPARVFVGVGELEEDPERYWPPSMATAEELRRAHIVSTVETLAGRLAARGYPGLRLRQLTLAGHHHLTAVPDALMRGLFWVFVGSVPAGTCRPIPGTVE